MVSVSADVMVLIGLAAIAAFLGILALRVYNHLISAFFYLTIGVMVALLPQHGYDLAIRGLVGVLALAAVFGIALANRYVHKEYAILWIIASIGLLGALLLAFDLDYAIFLVVGGIAVTGAILAMEAREIMHAVYYLGTTFIAVAAIYLLLAAEYLMVVQLLIYVGAVTILMSFAIMLTRRTIRELSD